MKKVAIIPLRAGSKGIPNKNKKRLLGKPLFTWVLNEAIKSILDEIYVFTDDKELIDFVRQEYQWSNKVIAMERSAESASDVASTELAMIEFAERIQYNFGLIMLLQATSPLSTKEDINKACELIEQNKADSVISLVRTKRFIWSDEGLSINYDFKNRPRRQDFNGLLIENGAIYACKKEVFAEEKNRLGGKIKPIEMHEDTLIEIDEENDFLLIEKLMEKKLSSHKRPAKIKLLVLDVDGVFTDGTVATGSHEELSKNFSLIDGMGLELLREEGILPVVLTSENSDIVRQRMNKLKIEHCYTGVRDKFSFLDNLLDKLNIERKETAYIGDDINDLANVCGTGLSFCPSNAVLQIKLAADFCLSSQGSKGAVREACDILINYNRRFNK